MRIAAFSDVHSNLQALSSALEDMAGGSVDLRVCCGDLVGYGPNPDEVIGIIRGGNVPTVMGNYDEGVGFLLEDCGCAYRTPGERETGEESLRWTKENSSEETRRFLRGLPRSMRLEWEGARALFVHGSPRRLNEYLYEDRPEDSLKRMLEPLGVDVLVFGHTHIPYHRVVGGVHMVNVGSLGKPKDGDPRACYSLIDLGDGPGVEFRRVDYPVEETARAITEAGLPRELGEALIRGGE